MAGQRDDGTFAEDRAFHPGRSGGSRKISAGDDTPWGRIGDPGWWGPKNSPEGRAHSKALDDEWNRRQQQDELFLKRHNQMQNPSQDYEEEPGDYYERQTSWDNER